MTREAIGILLLLFGAVVARLTLAGDHMLFVKGSLGIPLLVSAAIVIGLGLATYLQAGGEDDGDDHAVPIADSSVDAEADGGHHHVGHGPRMGALLAAPLVAMLVVPTAPLGALAADNGAANRLPDESVYAPLPEPAGDGAVELLLTEVVGRAVLEPETLDGTTVRTDGFVAAIDDRPGAYLLSRFTVGCCAVDAAPYQLVVDAGPDQVPPEEDWVRATLRPTGEIVADGEEELPVFELVGQDPIPVPENPYIY